MGRYVDFIREFSNSDVFSSGELAIWQPGSDDSRYGQMKRAIASGEIEGIRRGLYILGSKHRKSPPHLFELAQYIYGPSYISCESALSFWGLIPERVYTTTSITSKRSTQLQTPLGAFSFQHISYAPLFLGVHRIHEEGHVFFIASPTKSLLDYVWVKKIQAISPLEWLHDSLRIEGSTFISSEELLTFLDYYQGKRMNIFIQSLQKELLKCPSV